MKKAILVVGMHRSGTSAITGVIHSFGAYLGEHLLPPAKENPKGFFENRGICFTNDYVMMAMLGTSWDDERDIEIDYDREDVLRAIEVALTLEFGDQPIIAIKDPRISILLPYYQKVLTKLGYEIYYVRTSRDDFEIVASLIVRNGGTADKWRKLIEKYDNSLNLSLPVIPVIVPYKELIEKKMTVINRLKQGLPFLNYSKRNIDRAKKLISKKLKHH